MTTTRARAALGTAALGLLGAACGGPPPPEEPGPIQASGVYQMPAAQTATASPPPSETDAPEISRSAGKAGGVVVLWPRIVLTREAGKPDADTRAIAGKVQARVAELARAALPNATVDVRPEPERVCPRQGCAAPRVGVLLERVGGGCAAIVLAGDTGVTPDRLVPWSGRMVLDADSVPFREPPERVVHVKDFQPCETFIQPASANDAAVTDALRRLR
jgi:hypothetical protein